MNRRILLLILVVSSLIVLVLGGCKYADNEVMNAMQIPQSTQIPQATQVSQASQMLQTTPMPQATQIPHAKQIQPTQTPQATQPGSVNAGPGGKVAAGNKVAYITIDDGPSSNNTNKNLDTLKRYGIKATFFVLPRKDVESEYKRILDEGHEIGNHSYSHDYKLLYSSAKVFEEDLLNARKMIEDKLGYTTKVYRFPGGTMGRDKALIDERVKILEKYGYKYYNWDVTTGDSDTGPTGKVKMALVNNVLNNTKGRNKLIILMHDSSNRETTTEALPNIIEGLSNMGYTFDVLSNY